MGDMLLERIQGGLLFSNESIAPVYQGYLFIVIEGHGVFLFKHDSFAKYHLLEA